MRRFFAIDAATQVPARHTLFDALRQIHYHYLLHTHIAFAARLISFTFDIILRACR